MSDNFFAVYCISLCVKKGNLAEVYPRRDKTIKENIEDSVMERLSFV